MHHGLRGMDALLYCMYCIHLYSASCSAYQSEALPMRETKREEKSLERRKTGTWENRHLGKYGVWIRDLGKQALGKIWSVDQRPGSLQKGQAAHEAKEGVLELTGESRDLMHSIRKLQRICMGWYTSSEEIRC